MSSEPTAEQIHEWKQEYGDGEIYSTEIKGRVFVFRTLNVGEFMSLPIGQGNGDQFELEDLILSWGVLYPKNAELDRIPAGIASTIAEEILEVSGFLNPSRAKELLDQKREESGQLIQLMKIFISAAMPSFDVNRVNQMSFSKLIETVVMAEKIFEIQGAILRGDKVSLDLLDPNEELNNEAAERHNHALNRKPGQAGFNDPVADRLYDKMPEAMQLLEPGQVRPNDPIARRLQG